MRPDKVRRVLLKQTYEYRCRTWCMDRSVNWQARYAHSGRKVNKQGRRKHDCDTRTHRGAKSGEEALLKHAKSLNPNSGFAADDRPLSSLAWPAWQQGDIPW
jgi:hypothetical protein